MSLFCCPVCASSLTRGEKSYTCPNGHCFDLAAAGYAHLLPANRMHSKTPGDDAGMVAARSEFLANGYYAPLMSALAQIAYSAVGSRPCPTILDSGCGEGYYTGGIYDALSAAGHKPVMAGIDISKFALRRAARRVRNVEFAVASVYHLPLCSESVDLVLDVFAPLSAEEFYRVLRAEGYFVYVVPSARHLWQMKEVLYEHPYENQVQQTLYDGFAYCEIVPVRYEITLTCQQDIHALFQMTPYYWKTPKAGAGALAKLDTLTTEIAFDIHVFRKSI
jgi:23S rRNA (guanine745-N1)-methyltransferase